MCHLLGRRARLAPLLTGTVLAGSLLLAPAAGSAVTPGPGAGPAPDGSYHNPLAPDLPGGGTIDSCADPTVLHGQRPGDRYWYLYCTTDPLNDDDVDDQGDLRFHPIPMSRSRDLLHWNYVGDALPEAPDWAADGAGIWAPDVVYSATTDRYYLTFVVTDTDDSLRGPDACHSTGDSALGIAVSDSPTGPWRVADQPLVGPRPDPGADCAFFWTYDPDVLGDTVRTSSTLYYGSYYGGIQATRLVFDDRGASIVGEPTQVAIGNRYEGANVVRRGRWYWLFASATNCCNGPLTSYGVFVGRSRSPLGPFLDRDGQSLLAGRVGGTPVLLPNGNRWLGTGHNSVFTDAAGRWWTVYHAVDRHDPYFATQPGFTRRPPLLDPLDWVGGWPTVRADRGASDRRMPAPATQPHHPSGYHPQPVRPLRLGRELPKFSDGFEHGLDAAWSWTGTPPAADTYAVEDGKLRVDTQAGDIARTPNTAAVLSRDAPRGDYLVQTRVRLNLPPEGCCHNYVQAGIVVHDGRDRFVKLVHVSIWETRQTEFAKEIARAPEGRPVYGNGVVGPPGDLTSLRIVVDHRRGPDHFTAYTRQDGGAWVRGGTWTHNLGQHAEVGLVSMGGEGYVARFLDVRVWRVRD
ncbi:MAG: Arabinan endo,5-alpha-L-arabinosidase [Nocardioides sp.]|nr:Arabinan endo,5-alpha-L-arabinosidase [Nocardioides sp.]